MRVQVEDEARPLAAPRGRPCLWVAMGVAAVGEDVAQCDPDALVRERVDAITPAGSRRQAALGNPLPTRYAVRVTELRVVVPDEIAERLAAEAAERHMAPEDLAAQVLVDHVPGKRRLRFIGIGNSGQPDAAARSEEILREHFGS